MDYDPSVTPGPEQQAVTAHDRGVLFIDGPARSGRTTALVSRAVNLSVSPRNAGRAGGVVFIAATHREAAVLGAQFTRFTNGASIRTSSMAHVAQQIASAHPADHGPPGDGIVSVAAWRRAARQLLDRECTDPETRNRLWPASGEALVRESVRKNAVDALGALRAGGGLVDPPGPDGAHWQELHSFGMRVEAVLPNRQLLDANGAAALAIRRLRSGRVRNPFAACHVLADDAHRLHPVFRMLLAELAIGSPTTGVPASSVISGDSRLAPWLTEFASGGAPVSLIHLQTMRDTPPVTELQRLRHRALEADTVISSVERLRASGMSYANIAIVLPAGPGPISEALSRVATRRGVPIHGQRHRLCTNPLVACLADLTRWAATGDPNYLSTAVSMELIAGTHDPRLPSGRPRNQATLARMAFGLWETIIARAALQGTIEGTDGCRVFLDRLSEPPVLSGEATSAIAAPVSHVLLQLIADASSGDSGPLPNAGNPARYGEFDAVSILSAHELGGRSFEVIITPSMVEGSWPRPDRIVEGGWDVREIGVNPPALHHELDQRAVAAQRALFHDLLRRASVKVIAIAAPEPGVLASRFVEGWPETAAPEWPGSPERSRPSVTRETSGPVPCFPESGLRLSATRLDSFENCPLNFAYQYVAGVRGPGGVPASVGNMVHAALEAFLLPLAKLSRAGAAAIEGDHQSLTREALFAALDARWDRGAFPYRPQEADYRNRAETWLEQWFLNELPKLESVIAVEHRFSIPVGPHTLTGSIDRVSVATDGVVEIVDYKTGSAPLVRDRVDPDNLQLATYHLAAVTDPALRPFGAPGRLRLHYLTESIDVDQPVPPGHEEQTKARILSTATSILNEGFTPSVEADCEYCNFKRLCPLQPEGRTVASAVSNQTKPIPVVIASKTTLREARENPPGPTPGSGPGEGPGSGPQPDFQPLGEQTRAITHAGSPLLIVAGAGSGKTTVLAKRIVHLVEKRGWRPDQILGLTFSNKAAGNLRWRVTRELGAGNDANIMTYHAFGASVIQRYGERIGLPSSPQLLDRARAWQLLLDSLNDVTIASRKTGNISSLVTEALTLASSCADHVVSIDEVAADSERMLRNHELHPNVTRALRGRLDLCSMAQAYEQAKIANGCIDFGDQIRLALRLVEEHPDIVNALSAAYPVALLDEYQDTNYAQRRLMEALYRGSNTLTAVGDDMQSIYAFRGAHIRNLLDFESHFPGATECRLETNHRSGPEIVHLAGQIQSRVDNARPKELVASGRIPKAEVERFVAADDFDEAGRIAEKCLYLHAGGQPWSEMAVLCRKRRLIPAISETLIAAGIPVEVIGLGGLLVRPEIVDLVSWLEIVAADKWGSASHPFDSAKVASPDPSVALLRILRGEPYRLGMRDLAALARAARQRSRLRSQALPPGGQEAAVGDYHDMLDLLVELDHIADVADLSAEAWTRLHAFNSIRAELVVARSRSLPGLIEHTLRHTRAWEQVDARGTENLIRFIDLAARFEPLSPGEHGPAFGRQALVAFLEYLQLIAMSEDELPEAVGSGVDAVNIMTIHQAKGLEFETVFVPGLAGKTNSRSKIFPDGRAAENGVTQAVALPPWLKGDADRSRPSLRTHRDLDAPKRLADLERDREEKRLFYVAATRAKTRLIFSAAHWYAGVAQPQGISPFYEMLGQCLPPVPETHHSNPAVEDPRVGEMQRRNARYLAEVMLSEGPNPDPVRTGKAAEQPSGRRPIRVRKGAAGSTGPHDQGSLFPAGTGTAVPSNHRLPVPTAFAATALSTYTRCPRLFFWTTIQPLPRRPSEAARIGTEVHRWIELRANGQLVLEHTGSTDAKPGGEPDEIDLVDTLEAGDTLQARGTIGARGILDEGQPRPLARGPQAQAGFLRSRFADRTPRHVEMPFAIAVGDHVVRGRIDAIYTAPDTNGIEIVDFKTGTAPGPSVGGALPDTDPTTVQLDVYGLVAVQLLNFRPEEIAVTACYLGSSEGPEYRTRHWTPSEAGAASTRITHALRAIGDRRFDPTPGRWCAHCDFEAFCEGARSPARTSED